MIFPENITLFLDPTALIMLLGLVTASCGLIMVKNSIEQCVNGSATTSCARLKGLILLMIALAFCAVGCLLMLQSGTMMQLLMSWCRKFISYLA